MSRRRFLAVSKNLVQLRRIVAHIESVGGQVDAVRTVDNIDKKVPHRYAFVNVVDDTDNELLEETLRRLRDRAQVIVLVPSADLVNMVSFLKRKRVHHVITDDEFDSGICSTAKKLVTGDIFGIEKYVPENTPVQYFRLRDFDGRARAIDAVLEYATENNVRRQVRNSIAQVCEELIMNALYDAPVDAAGKQIFAELTPQERVQAQSPKPVSVRYAATESQFVVAIRDRYGRLAKPTILAYLRKCIESPAQIDRKAYGAGLGLYLVTNAVAQYVCNVAFDVATEVICTFDRGVKTPMRQIGVFVHPGNADLLEQTQPPTVPKFDDS